MTDALATLAPAAPVVTREQLDLIRKTVAQGATDVELQLFLYDCERRGVHPLDKLLYFTKRSGRYAPVVGIDFLRMRAADTKEMAGSDDAVYLEGTGVHPVAATVIVYRLTRGQRFAYSATARWSEYCPDPGPTGRGDSMWRRFPYLMLSKCAESLALRKAFPAQLAGLYVGEELEQARPDFQDQAQAIADSYASPVPGRVDAPHASSLPTTAVPSVPNGGASGQSDLPRITPYHADSDPEDARDGPELHTFAPDRVARLPDGVVFITHVASTPTRNANVTRTTLSVVGNAKWPANQTTCTTINETRAATAEGAWHTEQPVAIKLSKGKYGFELAGIEYARERPVVADAPTEDAPLRAHDIPFRS